MQEFKFDTTPGTSCSAFYFDKFDLLVKQYNASLILEKIDQSLENVVNSVMQAGNQAVRFASRSRYFHQKIQKIGFEDRLTDRDH